MELGKTEARNYMHEMGQAVMQHLLKEEGLYSNRDGHLRLARECGYALNDFTSEGQREILHGSYGQIYVIGCNLKPLLDASEWINEMRSQIKK